MSSVRNILKNATAGGTLTTAKAPCMKDTLAFEIANDTDISLDFDLQMSTLGYEWSAGQDPTDGTQITFTVASGETAFRHVTGSVNGMLYTLVCDSTGATGTVNVNSIG